MIQLDHVVQCRCVSCTRPRVQGLLAVLVLAACNPSVGDDDSSFKPPPPPPTCTANQMTNGLELCNGIDDDCDGVIDEAPGGEPLRQPCESVCGGGLQVCDQGQWTECLTTEPAEEVCNGVDDNCNDTIDEGCACIHGMTEPCGTDVGACRTGIKQCVNGMFVEACHGEVGPVDEICNNGTDDNCDGRIDENCQCAPDETQVCGKDVGICQSGTLTCDQMGQWGTECVGSIEAETETCNGLDDDCDGEVDWNTATGTGWRADPFEGTNTCASATPMGDVVDSAGWTSLEVSDPTNLSTYPTIYPPGDEDWYAFRAQTVSHGACFPGATQCAFVLAVQVELSGAANPEDYEVCVAVTDNCGSVGQNNLICSNMSRWVPDANSYVLGVKWAGTCGSDDSRQVKVRVRNTESASACGYYQVHANFAYDPDEPCP